MNTIESEENKVLGDLISPFKKRGMDLSLERMKHAIKDAGDSYEEIPAIQVAGTNGKGSIANFLESCLKEAGIKVGCSTSPHLINWCERIRINGSKITFEEFQGSLIKLEPIAKKHNLTSFERVILTAFDHFYLNKVELMVLEVGLGGRLDATTAHPYRPLIGMGSIGLDHCEHLGYNLQAIAKEKAGVISSKSTIVSSIQDKEVTKVIQQVVSMKSSKVAWVKPLTKEWELGIPGNIQRENAAVAKGVLNALSNYGWEIQEETIRRGLAKANWPGRLQRTSWRNISLILDGAHNPQAAKELAKERFSWPNQKEGVNWIFGIQEHKKAPEIIRTLVKKNDNAWIVPISKCSCWKASQLSKIYPALSNQLHEKKNVIEVLEELHLRGPKEERKQTVITGSLYLIGEFLSQNKASI